MGQAIRIVITTLGLVLGSGVSAHAGYLFVTPIALADGPYALLAPPLIVCTVTNYDVKPVVVGVTLYSKSGDVIPADLDECNGAPIPSGHTCQTKATLPPGGWCRFISSSLKIGA